MTYLVTSLASCLFFAQLLGLLLGWLLWGYAASQRKKEIVLLRKRLADVSVHTPKTLEDTAAWASLGASETKHDKLEKLEGLPPMADLPPLPPIPPDLDELESSKENNDGKSKDALLLELRRQIEALKDQLIAVGVPNEALATEPQGNLALLGQKLTDVNGGHGNGAHRLQEQLDALTAEMANASYDRAAFIAESEKEAKTLRAELSAVISDRERNANEIQMLRAEVDKHEGHAADLQRQVTALTSEIHFTSGEKERLTGELRTAKVDFEKRSSWLTKRIHELEKSAEDWEKTKSDWALAKKSRNDSAMAVAEAPGAAHDAALAELNRQLQSVVTERDALKAELSSPAKTNGSAPPQVSELQEALRNKDAQLAEQVARVERLLWRVSELEALTKDLPHLEDSLRTKDAALAELTATTKERDAHIRTLLRRMTELEPLSDHMTGLQTKLQEQEAALVDKAATEAKLAAATARFDQLQQELKKSTDLEAALQQKQATLAELEAAHAERGSLVQELQARLQDLQARVDELTPLPAQLHDLSEKHQADLTRLKVTSAQRLKKLRQGITNFKG